jgi:hypothetical protein
MAKEYVVEGRAASDAECFGTGDGCRLLSQALRDAGFSRE